MKKIFCLLSTSMILFSSCSKDEPSEAPLSDGVLLKSKIETFSDASVLTTTYTYTENSLLTAVNSDGESLTYTYDVDGRIATLIDISRNSDGDLETTTSTYTYDEQDRLLSVVFMDETHYDYIYNSNGTITENHYDAVGTATADLVESYIYTLQTGNLLYEQGTGVSTGNNSTFLYDSKNNPLKNVHQGLTVLFFEDYIANNNITTYSNSTSPDDSFTSTYIYNSFNYPAAGVTTYGNGDVVNTQYIYE